MNAKHWWTIALAAAVALAGCANEPGEPAIGTTVAALTSAAADAEARHLRVVVSYEAGRFQLVSATEVARPLKQPRSGRTRSGVHFVARRTGQASFVGRMEDPRRVHLEAPDPSGKIQRVDVPAPGKQVFQVLVPVGSETVDFFEPGPPQQAGFQAQPAQSSLTAPSTLIGSVDLRSAP
jgi:hypothetical protein